MLQSSLPRTGVVICRCGQEIGGRLDIPSLQAEARALPGVVLTHSEGYACSKDSRARLGQAIQDHQLDRVLVAGCSPGLVSGLFQKCIQQVGLDTGDFYLADIREGCARVHRDDPEAANRKAGQQIAAGVARLANGTPGRTHTTAVRPSAMVIGGGLGALTAALVLAENQHHVTLLQMGPDQPESALYSKEASAWANEQNAAARHHPHIELIQAAAVTSVSGRAGDYRVSFRQGRQACARAAGAVIIAADALESRRETPPWEGLIPNLTLSGLQHQIASWHPAAGQLGEQVVFILPDARQPAQLARARMACRTVVRQAAALKQLGAADQVTVLFRDLYLTNASGQDNDDFQQAKDMGVSFFRYHQEHPPLIGEDRVMVDDPIAGQRMELACGLLVTPGQFQPPAYLDSLAALFRLPQDQDGFLLQPRIRLKPDRAIDSGIYLLGGAHQPTDINELLLHAYLVSGRALRFLRRDTVSRSSPVVEVDSTLCTGCAQCVSVCPTSAIRMMARDSVLSQSDIDWTRCIGCGSCLVACPVHCLNLPGWEDAAIFAQIEAALKPAAPAPVSPAASRQPKILLLGCEWSAAAAAAVAGARRIPYAPSLRLVRLNCGARFDPMMALWAFLNGADGVMVGVCHQGECHYGHGSSHARQRLADLELQLAARGIDPRRLKLMTFTGDNGVAFADAVTEFSQDIQRVMNKAGGMPRSWPPAGQIKQQSGRS